MVSVQKTAFVLAAVLLLFALARCATPSQPTGGPPDRTPPELEYSEPPTGTTLFEGDRIRFHFSKHVDRNSFRNAFRMEPDLDIDYDIQFRRRSATVRFRDPLPDTTTMIFTLGTSLADTRNNRLAAPIQLALSTGPDIDEGQITATVRDAQTGKGKMGETVYLFRHPVDLSSTADYVGESDSSGVVRFNYLRQGTYLGFWIDDRTFNRRWMRNREAAQPFRTDSLLLEPGAQADLGTVYVARIDTIPPELQAVGMLSSVRLRLRFNEPVFIDSLTSIGVYRQLENSSEENDTEDTPPEHAGQTANRERHTEAIALYTDPDNPEVLFAQSLDPLPDTGSYSIDLQGITDEAGNQAVSGVATFAGSDEADTTMARIVGHDTRFGIGSEDPVVVRYARLVEQEQVLLDSLTLIEAQTAHTPWPHARLGQNRLYIYPAERWRRGETYEVRAWDEQRLDRQTIRPSIYHEQELGSLDVLIAEAQPGQSHRLLLRDEQGEQVRAVTFDTQVELTGIMPGAYTLQVYELRPGRTQRDVGSVDPFRPPARFFLQHNIPVERGFASQIEVQWP